MLPTTERRLRKNFASAVNNFELKIKWLQEQANNKDIKIKSLHKEILILKNKNKRLGIAIAIIILGFLLYSLI